MTTTLIARLGNLATAVQAHASEEVRLLAPKLRVAADDVEHYLEAWVSSVDDWVEAHFTVEAQKVREDAGEAYRNAVQDAHKLIDEAKAHL